LKTKLKILHLEDTPADAELVERELKKGKIHFEKLLVNNKKAFEKALKEFAPDIILADHTLPSFDSMEAIKIIKQKALQIPFILVTSTVSDEYAVEIMKAGADDYILKDRLHRLPQAVHNAMEKKRADIELQLAYEKIVYANRMYSFISHVNQTIVHAKDEQQVFKEVCRIAIECGKFKAAWIGLIDTENQKINLVQARGILPKDLSKFENVTYKEKGPQYYVLQSNNYYICNNVQQDLELENWKLFAAENGFNSVMVLPIKKLGTIIGTFNLYAEEINFFNEGEMALLVEAADDISFALEVFEKEHQRKVFKEKLVSVSERLQIATSATNIGIWDWDLVNNNLIWDKTMYSIFDLAEDEFSGAYEAWAATVHPEDIAKANEDVQSALRGETKFDTEFRIVWSDKSIRYIKGDAIVVRDDSDKPLRMIGTYLDITARKKANEENRFKANLLNTIGQAAIATDLNGVVNYWNQAAENIYGWTKEEALGKHIMDLTTSEASNEQALQIMEKLKNGQTWLGEFKVRKKDGTNFPALITNSPIFDEKNILSGIIGISSDITEMKKLEELLEKTNRLAAIGSWEIDVVKGTVFWSDITKEIREVDKDYVPLLEVGISYFKEGIHKEKISQKVQDCIENGTPWDEEMEIVTFKGNHKWVRTIGEGEFLNGKCLKIHGSFQDISERKKVEVALRKSESNLQAIFENTSEGFILADKNGIVKAFNTKTAQTIFLNTDKEIKIGSNLNDFIYPSRKESYAGVLKKVMAGETIQYEHSFERKNGDTKWFSFTINPAYNKTREIEGICVTSANITESKEAEQQLQISEAFNKGLISSLSSHITVIDESGTLITVNKAWNDFAHENGVLSLDSISMGSNYFDVCKRSMENGDSDAAEAFAGIQSVFKKEKQYFEMEYPCHSPEQQRWFMLRATNFGIDTQRVVIAHQNITARKQAENSLQLSQSNLTALIENTDASIYSLDTEFRYITFNKRLHDALKQIYNLDIKIGDNVYSFLEKLYPNHANRWRRTYSRALKGETVKFEREFTVGELYNCSSFSINPIWENNVVVGLSCFVYDITNQKQEQQQKEKLSADLIQRNRDLEQFTFIVSHNLRAPTANIMGFSENLQDETFTPLEQKEFLNGLSTSVAALDTVIKDINTILQVKREVNEKKEVIIFSKLVNDIMTSISHLMVKHSVCIKIDFSEVDEIYSLKVYMHSIFYNLISNSIKYSRPNELPLIEIRSKKENGKIILIFKDNGLGIDMKTKGDKIFGLYKRFHSHVEGKGMGLFMVKTQVESIGGKISIASELNKGTEFTIVFEK